MLNSIKKARSYTEAMRSGQVKHQAVPRAFSAPPSGYGFYGQGTHYAQVLNYTAWAFIAIQALIREIAGGKAPNLGNVTERPEEDLRKSKSLWHAKSYSGTVRKNLGGPQEHEQFEPWPKNHPGVVLFRNPNSPYVAYDLWAYHTLFFHLSGECHWWALRDRMGIPRELWIIPTHWKRNITGPDGMPVAYEIRAPWGQVQYALAKDVVSFYEHSPLSMWEGLAVTTACGRWLDIYDSVMTTQLAMFKNGADPSLHVELDESYPNPDDIMLTRYYAKWFRRFQGETNAGLPVVTGPGVKVTKIGSTPSEIGFEASEEAIRNRVLAAFGVPQALVTGDPTVDTSAYAPQRTFTRFTVNPKLTYMSQRITEKLLRPHWPDGCCWWDDRTPNSQEDLIAEINARAAHGAISPNEVRAMFGNDPWPHGGDDPLFNNEETNWATGKRQESDVEMDKAFRKALTGLDGASGGYLTPPQHRPLFRDEQDANEAHKSMMGRLATATKNGNGYHKAHA